MEKQSEQIEKTDSIKETQLSALLYLLQTHVEEFQKEIEKAYALHKIGEKTELVKQLEDTINNPIGSLHKISSNIDNQCLGLIDNIVEKYFSNNKSILKSAFRTNSRGHLHYSIVLRQDNIENRTKIFEFFDLPVIMDVSEKFPVYFQFVSEDTLSRLKGKVSDLRSINL